MFNRVMVYNVNDGVKEARFIDPRFVVRTRHAGGQLDVSGARHGSALLLRADGEVDASNVSAWRRLLGEAASTTPLPGPLIVDTDQLTFMASCAFVALAEESARCRRRGIRLLLVSSQPIVARILAVSNFEPELPLYRNVDAALASAAECNRQNRLTSTPPAPAAPPV